MLQRLDLVQWTQLFFGIILIGMMLYRRQGLIPATGAVGAAELRGAACGGRARAASGTDRHRALGTRDGTLLEVRDVTVRFGGLVALNGVSFDGAGRAAWWR